MKKIRWLIYRIELWLDDHRLVVCFRCGRWMWQKDSIVHVEDNFRMVPVCRVCRRELAKPFTMVGK